MGNEASTAPDTYSKTFKFEIQGGVITVDAKKSSQTVQETDLAIFNLTDKAKIMQRYFQKDYSATYFMPSNPNSYTLDWSKVMRVLYPMRAQIVKQSNKSVTLQSTELKNPSKERGDFTWNVNKSEFMKETYKRKWFAETSVTSKVEIAYKVLSLGSIDFSRKTTEEVESEQIRQSKLSTQTEMKVTLEPNRSVRVDLQAMFHIVDVEVEYEARLSGAVEVFFGVLRGATLNNRELAEIPGVPTFVIYKEIITFEYYTGDSVTMTTIGH